MGLFAELQRQAPGAKCTASYLRACSAAKNADVQYIISTRVCGSETVAIMNVCGRYDCLGEKLASKVPSSSVVATIWTFPKSFGINDMALSAMTCERRSIEPHIYISILICTYCNT
jgi:hypothetical protein